MRPDVRELLLREVDPDQDTAADRLGHRVDAERVRIGEARDPGGGQRPAAAVGAQHGDRLPARLGHDGHCLVRVEAVARHAGRQHPFRQVLHQDGKGDPEREVGLVEVEAHQHLAERLIADQEQRRLRAGQERAAEARAAQVLAAGDVDVLQVNVRQQGIAGVGRPHPAYTDRSAARQGRAGRRVDHERGTVRQRGRKEAIEDRECVIASGSVSAGRTHVDQEVSAQPERLLQEDVARSDQEDAKRSRAPGDGGRLVVEREQVAALDLRRDHRRVRRHGEDEVLGLAALELHGADVLEVAVDPPVHCDLARLLAEVLQAQVRRSGGRRRAHGQPGDGDVLAGDADAVIFDGEGKPVLEGAADRADYAVAVEDGAGVVARPHQTRGQAQR